MELNVHIPETVTKQLMIQRFNDGGKEKRKLVISSNFLPLFGFEPHAPVKEEVIGEGKGLVVTLVDSESANKKVYVRRYNKRKNNPLEAQLDMRHQSRLERALGDAEHVHITFTRGKVTIVPVTTQKAKMVKRAKSAGDLRRAFVALSSGVDAHLLHTEGGFRIDGLCEYRPRESRDKNSLEETGALNFAANVPVRHVFNENIETVDMQKVAKAVASCKTSLLVASPQCDDFTPLKSRKEKLRSLDAAGCDGACNATSADMMLDILELAKYGQFPFILLENVRGFFDSEAYRTVFRPRLQKMGYFVYENIMDARDYGGLTKRTRFFMFATAFGSVAFDWPAKKPRRIESIWDAYIAPALYRLRDVTHSKSIQDGANCGRLRTITRKDASAPTFTKSQSRMAKDTCVIEDGGRYYMPDNELVQKLMGIPDSFSLESCGQTIASEILGQSLDGAVYSEIVRSVAEHLDAVTHAICGRVQTRLRFA